MSENPSVVAFKTVDKWEARQSPLWKTEEAKAKANKIPILYAMLISSKVEGGLENLTKIMVRTYTLELGVELTKTPLT